MSSDNSGPNAKRISELLHQAEHYDADNRFMAVHDLVNELEKLEGTLTTDQQVQVRQCIMKLVDDRSSDVSAIAAKCISVLERLSSGESGSTQFSSKADSEAKQAIHLSSSHEMPLVGLGVWKIPKDQTPDAVYNCIKMGYRLVDGACDYGNEKEVGQGLKRALDDGVVKREDVFVTSKLWNTYHRRENVKKACLKTLSDLGLEYLDLYLIHFPISLKYVDFDERYPPEWDFDPSNPGIQIEDVTIRETWEAMEELVKDGLVKSIGVANFNCALLMDLLKYAKIPPAVNQIEIHPYLGQTVLRKFCQDHGVAVTAFSSFGPTSYKNLFDFAKNTTPLLEHATIVAIGSAHDVSPAQVLLRWSIQRNVAVIPKSTNAGRQAANLQVFGFSLSDEEMKQIDSLECNARMNDPGFFCGYPIWN